MNKQIFITNGYARSGKDTFAKLLSECLKDRKIYVEKISSIDGIKDLAYQCGWDGTKDEKSRQFLSDLKMLTTNFNDYPFNYILNRIHCFMTNDSRKLEILLIDIREPSEIKKLVDKIGCKTIFIENDRVKGQFNNFGDANVENYDYDYVIKNNGTLDDFIKEIESFIKKGDLDE